MKSNTVINSKELMLLCIIRNNIVRAKNLKIFVWTIRHGFYVHDKLRDLPVFYEGNDLKLMKDNFCKEANEKIPVQESIFRNFIVNEANFVSLSDKDEDMSWYGPFMDEATYDGDFELEIELSSREKQIINQYCN